MNELVSIIIPVYNAEEFIDRALKSILEQNYSNIEVILVDDGSIDGSFKKCQDLSMVNKNVYIYHINNSGVSVARNYGLKKAVGKYIMFVDADDSLNENYIKDSIDILEKEEIDLVICNYYIIDSINKKREVNNCNEMQVTSVKELVDEYWNYYHLGYINSPCNKVYKKSIIDTYDIKFPCDIKMGEDCFFNIDYLKQIRKIKVLNNYYYNYMIYPTQSSKKLFKNYFYILTKKFDKIEELLKMYSKFDNMEFITIHYNEYFDDIKMAMKYLLKDKEMPFKDKWKELRMIVSNHRTKIMLSYVKSGSLKDKLIFYVLRIMSKKRRQKNDHFQK